ncbi:MAG: sugar transferase, partial [Peptostreptococcaceae bacterium]|nr:sugar transferase [Peptostreptococcaceae bacterium]
MIKENQKILNAINVIIDAFIVVLSYFIAYKIRVNSDSILYIESISFDQYIRYLLVVLPIYIVSYYMFKLYTAQRLKSITHEISKIVRANIIATSVFFVVLFFIKSVNYSRYMIIIFMIYNIALTVSYRIILRYVLRRIRKKGFNIKRAFLIGTSDTAMDFLKKTQKNMQWGYKIIGIFEDVVDEKKQAKLKNKFPLEYIPRYTYLKLEEQLSQKTVDEVVIGMKLTEYEKLEDIIKICEKSGVKTQIIPDYLKYIPARPEVEQIDDITIINIRHVPLDNPINKFIKRMIDIVVSLLAIVIAFPIMILTAIAIRLESKGSVIYKQERVGY